MKMLRITGCTDSMMWYADKIGQEVPYHGIWPGDAYVSRDDSGYANRVEFKDAEIVEVE